MSTLGQQLSTSALSSFFPVATTDLPAASASGDVLVGGSDLLFRSQKYVPAAWGVGGAAPSGVQIFVQAGADATIGAVARGHSATQSADLQQWQNSAGRHLSILRATGSAYFGTSDPGTDDALNIVNTDPTSYGHRAAIVFGYTSNNTNNIESFTSAWICGLDLHHDGGLNFSWRKSGLGLAHLQLDSSNPAIMIGANDGATAGASIDVTNQNASLALLSLQGFTAQATELVQFWQLDSIGSGKKVGIIDAVFADNTHATWKGRTVLYGNDYNANREGLRIEGDGSAARIGFLGATAVVRQTLAAAATDAATTQTLANSLRTALINLGLGV